MQDVSNQHDLNLLEIISDILNFSIAASNSRGPTKPHGHFMIECSKQSDG